MSQNEEQDVYLKPHFTLLISFAALFTPLAVGSDDAKSRAFRLNYGATLTQLPAAGKVRVWLPVPRSTADQKVERLPSTLPATAKLTTEPKYGNQMLYFEQSRVSAGEFALQTAYKITRHESRALQNGSWPEQVTDAERSRFLAANRRVPVAGKPIDLLANVPLTSGSLETGRWLYDQVDRHVRYDKSKPGYGEGDVLWVCDSRFGNCTDFHSLFISLCRSRGIPARFEIGFPLPPKRGQGTIGGYHCWASFFAADRGWVPVDISEADKHPEMKDYYFGNLTENRVSFTTGRDIDLVPQQDGEPLNYFIYPYVEVDGKPLPKEQIKLSFTYEDH